MRTRPIVPAEVVAGPDGVPWSALHGDRYHPAAGAFEQARHVFLGGNGLPGRWRGRSRFVVLETGFGLGNNFLATRDAWHNDPARCDRLDFVSIEKHPLERDALARWHAASALAPLARELVDAWPPLAPGLHTLRFDGGRVRLLLAFGDADDWLPEIIASVDAFFLDGFAPARNPELWTPRVFKALARLAAPGATVATWSAARAVRDGLQAAGFEVRAAPGQGGKRDITVAAYAPRFEPRRAPARIGLADGAGSRHALIVGGGLAGCAMAWALAEQGWTSRVVDRLAAPASAASGNTGALFHGAVNAHDGPHARFNRAAALRAVEAVRVAREAFGAAGAQDGLLRLETARGAAGMQALLDALGLPPGYAQALDADAASRVAGLRLAHPAWFYAGGGWIDPRALARSYLERAGGATSFRGGARVARLRRPAVGPALWQALDDDDRVIDAAPVVVLANGLAARRLAGLPPDVWPAAAVRGQTTLLAASTPGLRLPAVPLAGAGYVLPALGDDRALCGASSEDVDLADGDDRAVDAALRPAPQDDIANLKRLAVLTGSRPAVEASALRGRAGIRCVAVDRLPLIGGVPLAGPSLDADARLDQPRFVPRAPGLFAFTALASRGVVWSALGAEIAAAAIGGAPCPVEASLLDAVDPGRFASRAARRR